MVRDPMFVVLMCGCRQLSESWGIFIHCIFPPFSSTRTLRFFSGGELLGTTTRPGICYFYKYTIGSVPLFHTSSG